MKLSARSRNSAVPDRSIALRCRSPAAVGMFVLLGDRIEALADSELTLILRGGTRLMLGEDGTMII